MGAEESAVELSGDFSARMSEDKKRCEISISSVVSNVPDVGLVRASSIVRLTREETFKLGQTLLLMTGSMKDG